MTQSDQNQIEELLRQQQKLIEMVETQSRNILVLYRRTTALALMLETISRHESMQMPKTIRAEIDASLRPEEFEALAEQDPQEFQKRYGEATYRVLKEQGLKAICRIGDLTTALKKESLQ